MDFHVLSGYSIAGGQQHKADAAEAPVLALGADLTEDQKAIVFSEMGITAEQAASYQTIYITNDMEHQYLDEGVGRICGRNQIPSSVLLIPQESGSGLSVETHNISYCTISMYRNALLTAGVAGREGNRGGAQLDQRYGALIGAVKAYEAYSGEPVTDEALEVATDELVLTGDLMDELNNLDPDQVSDMIAYLKQEIAERGLDDPEELENLVRQVAVEMEISLTDQQVSNIVDLLLKLGNLDIDANQLISQAKELYSRLESMGIELDGEKVGNFITGSCHPSGT